MRFPHKLSAKHLLAGWLVFLCCLSAGYAQYASYRFHRYFPKETGLSHNTSHAILQDHNGFMWFGTENGLDKFNGYDIASFREHPLDTFSLSNNYVIALVEDTAHMIWVGTNGGGLQRFDPRTEKFTSLRSEPDNPHSQRKNVVKELVYSQDHKLWIGYGDGGMDQYDPATKQFIRYRHDPTDPHSLSSNLISALVEDLEGKLWIGTSNAGLNCFDPETGRCIRFHPDSSQNLSITDPYITCLLADSKGNIWIGTGGEKVYRFNPKSGQYTVYTFPLTLGDQVGGSYSPSAIEEGVDGSILIGTHGRGLYTFDTTSNSLVKLFYDPSIPKSNDLITDLYCDKDGRLWMSTTGRSIGVLDPLMRKMSLWEVDAKNLSGAPIENIHFITETTDNWIWLATWKEGLHAYNPQTREVRSFSHDSTRIGSLASDLVWEVEEDSKGNLWIATQNGLDLLTPGSNSFTHYQIDPDDPDGLWHEGVRSLVVDRKDNIWIGTFEGLNFMDAKTRKISRLQLSSGQSFPLVWDLFEDKAGHVWIAVRGNGIYKWNPETRDFLHFQHIQDDPTSLSSNLVTGFCQDLEGRIWIGTETGGLNLWTPSEEESHQNRFKHWRTYNSEIPSDVVRNFTFTSSNEILMVTKFGLVLFDPAQNRWKKIPGPRQIDPYFQWPWKGKNDRYYLGSQQGIYYFTGKEIGENPHIPGVFITRMKILNKDVAIRGTYRDTSALVSPLLQHISNTRKIELKHFQNDLSFEFSGLNFTQPQHNKYAYRLEGYQDQWVETDAANRIATYTNLYPGTYTFRVKASNNDGIWNETGASLQIVITPPWWQTWWASMLYALLFFGMLWWIRKYEIRRQNLKHSLELEHLKAEKLKEQARLRSRFFANISHEFRTPLTIIQGIAQEIAQNPSVKLQEKLSMIRRNGASLLNLINQILDLTKLESGSMSLQNEYADIVNYLSYLSESFQSLAEHKHIQLHLITDLKYLYMDYDSARLFHIFSNLLSNAVKFTPEGGHIYLMMDQVEQDGNEMFQIKVKDTGIGIPAEDLPHIFERFYHTVETGGTGIGLELTREIVVLMGGEITVSSVLGKGSEFTVLLPVRHETTGSTNQQTTSFPPVTPMPNPAEAFSQGSIIETPVHKKDRSDLLIIEDNHDVVKYLILCLQNHYNIEVAYDGKQGIEKAIRLVPDVIISDVMMPLKNGFEVCEHIKKDPRTSHIPFILLTAKADQDSRIAGLQRGAEAYLAKPFQKEELLVRIQALLTTRQSLQTYYLSIVSSQQHDTLASPPDEAKWENPVLLKFREIIMEHIGDPQLSVGQISDAMHMSKPTLYRKIKSLTGKSSSELIHIIRLRHSQTLLSSSTLPITQVAFEAGFSSSDYFSRVFKKEFGMTPTAFRNSAR